MNASPHSVYVELGVAYLCLCERTFPRSVAMQYLEELQRVFNARHGEEVANASRPYHFVSFGPCAHSAPLGVARAEPSSVGARQRPA